MTYDLNALADGVLRDQALAAVNRLVLNGLPDPNKNFGRTQMKHLQQLAKDEPHNVKGYAKHQLEKTPDKATDIRAVWQEVMDCCEANPNGQTWSLQSQAREYFAPHWGALETPLPQGAAMEDRQERKRLSRERKAFLDRWTSEVTPVFFDFFCVEYVLRISQPR